MIGREELDAYLPSEAIALDMADELASAQRAGGCAASAPRLDPSADQATAVFDAETPGGARFRVHVRENHVRVERTDARCAHCGKGQAA